MGLREKVALIFVSVISLQIPKTSCMPRSLRKDFVKSYLQENNDVCPLFPSRAIKKPELSDVENLRNDVNKQERSVYKIYNFPDVEYPLKTISRQPFCYSYHESTDTNFPLKHSKSNGKNQTEISFINKLRKEAKIKRSRKNTNFIKPVSTEIHSSEFKSAPNSYYFNNLGLFPEVEYPVGTKETWTLNSWKPISFTPDNQLVNTDYDGYLKPKIVQKSIRTFLKPLSKDKYVRNYINIPKEQRKIKDSIFEFNKNEKIAMQRKSRKVDKSDRHNGNIDYSKISLKMKSLPRDFLKTETLPSKCDESEGTLTMPVGQKEERTTTICTTKIDNITCPSDKVTPIAAEREHELTSGTISESSVQLSNTSEVTGISEDLNNFGLNNNTDELITQTFNPISYQETQKLCLEPSSNNSFINKFLKSYNLNSINNKTDNSSLTLLIIPSDKIPLPIDIFIKNFLTDITPKVTKKRHFKTKMNLIEKNDDDYDFSLLNDTTFSMWNNLIIPRGIISNTAPLNISEIYDNMLNYDLDTSVYNTQSEAEKTTAVEFPDIRNQPINDAKNFNKPASDTDDSPDINLPLSFETMSDTSISHAISESTSNSFFSTSTTSEVPILEISFAPSSNMCVPVNIEPNVPIEDSLNTSICSINNTSFDIEVIYNTSVSNVGDTTNTIPNITFISDIYYIPVSNVPVPVDKKSNIPIFNALDTPIDNTPIPIYNISNTPISDVDNSHEINLSLTNETDCGIPFSRVINESTDSSLLTTDTIPQTHITEVIHTPINNIPMSMQKEPAIPISDILNTLINYISLSLDKTSNVPVLDETNELDTKLSLPLVTDSDTHISHIINKQTNNSLAITDTIPKTPIANVVHTPIPNTTIVMNKEPDTFIQSIVHTSSDSTLLPQDKTPNMPCIHVDDAQNKKLLLSRDIVTDTLTSDLNDKSPVISLRSIHNALKSPSVRTPLSSENIAQTPLKVVTDKSIKLVSLPIEIIPDTPFLSEKNVSSSDIEDKILKRSLLHKPSINISLLSLDEIHVTPITDSHNNTFSNNSSINLGKSAHTLNSHKNNITRSYLTTSIRKPSDVEGNVCSFCYPNILTMNTSHPRNTISTTYPNDIIKTTTTSTSMPVESVADLPIIDDIDTTTNNVLLDVGTTTEPYIFSHINVKPVAISDSVDDFDDLHNTQRLVDVEKVVEEVDSSTEDIALPMDIISNTTIFRTIEELTNDTISEIYSIAEFNNFDDVLQKLNSTNIDELNHNSSSYSTDTVTDHITPFGRIIIEPDSDTILLLDGPSNDIIDSQLTEHDTESYETSLPMYILYDTYIFKINKILSAYIYDPETIDDNFNNADLISEVLPIIFNTQAGNKSINQITNDLNLDPPTFEISYITNYDNTELIGKVSNTNKISYVTFDVPDNIVPITPTNDIIHSTPDNSTIPEDINIFASNKNYTQTFTKDNSCAFTENNTAHDSAIPFKNSVINLNLTQNMSNIGDKGMVLNDYLEATNTIVEPTKYIDDDFLSYETLIPVSTFKDKVQFCEDTIDSEPITDVPIL